MNTRYPRSLVYFPHAQDTLIAVGAIALSYGQLENTLKRVFCAATGMKYNDLSTRSTSGITTREYAG
jgi:hypothetical protein